MALTQGFKTESKLKASDDEIFEIYYEIISSLNRPRRKSIYTNKLVAALQMTAYRLNIFESWQH